MFDVLYLNTDADVLYIFDYMLYALDILSGA